MKKAILLMTLLLGVFIYAQEDPREINTEFKELMDATFESLEKNRVPHGILLDFGMEFTNVPAFNGTLTDSTYTDATTLRQIYNTLLMSRIVEDERSFVTPEQFSKNWQNNRSSGHIALSGMYYKYSTFAKDAYPERLHFEGDQFMDKYEGEIWLDPCKEKQTFAIAPPIIWYKGLSFDVLLPQEIFYSNTTEDIAYIEADFDDGQGYRELPFDEAVAVQYEEEGNKIWKYRVVLNNDEVLYAQSKIKIIAGLERKAWSSGIQSGHSIYTQEITATTAYLGQYGKVTLTIDLANPSASGWVTLVVDVSHPGCGSVSIERTIYIGTPLVTGVEEVSVAQTGHTSPFSPDGNCSELGLKLNFAPSFANIEDMEWEKVTTNYQWSQNLPENSNQYVVIAPQCNGPIKFKVRMKNSCGWSDWQELEYNITECQFNCSSNDGSIYSDIFVI